MSKRDLSIIDTEQWRPVQSPGLRAPRHQVPYDSPEVQNILSESFRVMFPNIVEVNSGVKRYTAMNVHQEDVLLKAVAVKNMNDIPKAEMMRLMEGWIRLRRKLQEGEIPKEVSSILLNFRVPNPRQSLDRYMLYKEGDEQRLIIRWGFETKDNPAVSLERAISILMDVPLGHMRSILSTSMSPTTSTVAVGQMVVSAVADEDENKVNNSIGSAGNYRVMFGIVAISVVMLSLGIYGISKALSLNNQQSIGISGEPEFNDEVELGQKDLASDSLVFQEQVAEELAPIGVEEIVSEVLVDKEGTTPVPSLEAALIHAPSVAPNVDLKSTAEGSPNTSEKDESVSLENMFEDTQARDRVDLLGDMIQ
ncbi:hypothetical protein [Rubritalea sp.]|uniref:hypothetical protein n=1 Tax=Rubritalea sp. TaxID=2109375 RepID=UPI003EF69731